MSLITLPAGFRPVTCFPTLYVVQRVNSSPYGGSEQAVDLLNDRWLMTCELPPSPRHSEGAWREAFINNLRGQSNTVALWHFTRPAPRGTMRGTLTLNASAAQGASSIVVTGGAGQAGTTLLAGDLLGVGSLLLQVGADCTANGSGVVTVPIANRLRRALSSGASVTWDKPTAEFRLATHSGVHYGPRSVSATSFDFVEKI